MCRPGCPNALVLQTPLSYIKINLPIIPTKSHGSTLPLIVHKVIIKRVLHLDFLFVFSRGDRPFLTWIWSSSSLKKSASTISIGLCLSSLWLPEGGVHVETALITPTGSLLFVLLHLISPLPSCNLYHVVIQECLTKNENRNMMAWQLQLISGERQLEEAGCQQLC